MKLAVNCSHCGAQLRRYATKSGNYFCDNAHKAAWQRAQREALGFTREWLEREYIEKRRSANDIAREIGRDSKRVWEWLRDYGIETRSRGTDYGQCFKRGQKSAFYGHRHSSANKERFRAMRLLDGHVPYLKDGQHWLHATKRKPASWKGGITAERQAFYATHEWRDAVKAVWRRDNATCRRCGRLHNGDRSGGAFHIHHIVSFKVKSLRSDPDNLVLLCAKCHRFVHGKRNDNHLFLGEAA